MRHGYTVEGGNYSADILGIGYPRVKHWEATVWTPGEGILTFTLSTKRQAKTLVERFAATGNWRDAMHKAAGGSFDDFLAGNLRSLPYRRS